MSISKEVLIVGACRTPIGSLNGCLSSVPSTMLGSAVIKGSLERAGITDDSGVSRVSEVIMGQTLMANQGQNPSRQASMGAGLPKEVPATSVNMLCGSGIWSLCMQTRSQRHKKGGGGSSITNSW